MVNYSDGKIYKISSSENEEVYIGSTCETLNIRLSKHKANYKRYINNKHHYFSACDILKYDSCKIELLEEFKAIDKNDLNKKERIYIESIKCINKNVPCRTQKEYYRDHIELFKNYYKDNQESIKEYQKKQYLLTKEKLEKLKKLEELEK